MDGTVTQAGFRRVPGSFATGVALICTTDGGGRPRGVAVNGFFSVSLDPPLVGFARGRLLRTSGLQDLERRGEDDTHVARTH